MRVRSAEYRTNVLSEISHELRTPLSSLRLFADLLQAHNFDSAKVQANAVVITEESTRLGWIVDNALALSMNDTAVPGRLRASIPNEIVDGLIIQYGPLLHDAIDVQRDLRAPEPLTFDVRMFEQVLLNMLDNARKHATGSQVQL
jgi:signal transduction histidine kinase